LKQLSWKHILAATLILAAIVYVLPTFKPEMWPHKTINLGLDLQGGMHLVLEVDADKAVENKVALIAEALREGLRKEKIRRVRVERPGPLELSINMPDGQTDDAFNRFFEKEFGTLVKSREERLGGRLSFSLSLDEDESRHIKKLAVEQALETIRNRIDQFGVSEPDIRVQGERRILIQLPGIKDTRRAKEIIGKTALLEFKLLDETMDPDTALKEGPPRGSEVLFQTASGRRSGEPFLVKKRSAITGTYLTDARIRIDSQFNEPYVGIEFDKKGARIFEKITGENINKRLAIVLDNKIYSAPVIKDRIPGGSASITGDFTMEEARDLAIVLRAGALPAPVEIIEERTVGPSLGTDSIKTGVISMLVGGLIVILFMLIYYKLSGLIANIALVMNIILIAGGLAALQATLTLPGIAGIILTIGMAVDANVLIFERIREELDLGRTPLAAFEAGYERATLTILDANITTLIAAAVLFQFGSGPVKGFAVTLSLGVLASLFTALILTKLIFEYTLTKGKMKTISI
jgi:preprotein translocase subunit SecD